MPMKWRLSLVRKAQNTLLNKARNAGLSDVSIEVMSREDVKIDHIKYIFDYIKSQTDSYNQNENEVANEAKRIFDFLLKKYQFGHIKTGTDFDKFRDELLPLTEKDMLLGSENKFHLYRAYKFVLYSPSTYVGFPSNSVQRNIYEDYKSALFAGTTHKIATALAKAWARELAQDRFWWHQQLSTLLNHNECLCDDLKNNAESSLLYYLMLRGICCNFCPSELALSRLYNNEKHCFKFKLENFDDYFIKDGANVWTVDEKRIAKREIQTHPLLTYVDEFRKQHNMEKVFDGDMDDNIFHKEQLTSLFAPEKAEIYKQCYNQIKSTFTVDDSAYIFSIGISTGLFVSVDYQEFRKIEVSRSAIQSRGWNPHYDSLMRHIQIFIAPDGRIFQVFNSGKTTKKIPMAMRHVLGYMHDTSVFGEFINYLMGYYQKKNRFVADVIHDCEKMVCSLPISFNDILACHNKTHFLHTKYKSSISMKTNWNKKNLNLSYMIIKSYPKVEGDVGKRILLQQNDVKLVPVSYDRNHTIDEKITQFIANVIYRHVSEIEKKKAQRRVVETRKACRNELREIETGILDDEWMPFENERVRDALDLRQVEREIYDYVRMCMISKAKVKIDVNSLRQAVNLHDELAHREHDSYYRRNTQPVNVPKNTRFKKLRDILPQDFEWIQTRKRLILETELQHHCVWSYANKISSDNCAIYSFVDSSGRFGENGEPKRYTIEFVLDKDKKTYQIMQVQGKYDRAHTTKMREYIQDILDKKQKEEKAS